MLRLSFAKKKHLQKTKTKQSTSFVFEEYAIFSNCNKKSESCMVGVRHFNLT